MQLKVVNMELLFKQHQLGGGLRLCNYCLKRVQTHMLKVRMDSTQVIYHSNTTQGGQYGTALKAAMQHHRGIYRSVVKLLKQYGATH
jgi:hypothetical protein